MTGENVYGAANGTASDDTYTPRNILITGGAGFIASHVAIRLTKNYSQYTVGLKPENFCNILHSLSVQIFSLSFLFSHSLPSVFPPFQNY
jgi:hypothetical protein